MALQIPLPGMGPLNGHMLYLYFLSPDVRNEKNVITEAWTQYGNSNYIQQ